MKTYAELLTLITQRGVHEVFGDVGEGWGIEQNPHELAQFLVSMQELGVKSCLEIGTGYKGGLSRFLAADMGWQVTTVDVQDYGHTFAGVEYFTVRANQKESYEMLCDDLGESLFDLVFIDGNHSYDSVSDDYVSFGGRAAKVIAFHDIDGRRDCQGVFRFWGELCNQLPQEQLNVATDWEGNQAGIGWIEL